MGGMHLVLHLSCLMYMTSAIQVLDNPDLEQVSAKDYSDAVVSKVLTSQSGCTCQKATYSCGCCLHMEAPKIKLNDTGCVNVCYLPDQYGISLTFSLDGKIVYNETVSARNPPPLCFGVPYLEKEASLCIDFYNLDISNFTFSGCIKVEARLIHVIVGEYDLGCFRLPLSPGQQAYQHQALKDWLNEIKFLSGKRKQAMFL